MSIPTKLKPRKTCIKGLSDRNEQAVNIAKQVLNKYRCTYEVLHREVLHHKGVDGYGIKFRKVSMQAGGRSWEAEQQVVQLLSKKLKKLNLRAEAKLGNHYHINLNIYEM